MEKEKGAITFEERISRVRELSQRYWENNFWYEECSPAKKEDCMVMQLSEEEVSVISFLVPKIFNKDFTVTRFSLISTVTPENEFVFGIKNGLGSMGGEIYDFEYLFFQNGECGDILIRCKSGSGRRIDHEIYPVLYISSMSEESQELISSMLSIVENRLV